MEMIELGKPIPYFLLPEEELEDFEDDEEEDEEEEEEEEEEPDKKYEQFVIFQGDWRNWQHARALKALGRNTVRVRVPYPPF